MWRERSKAGLLYDVLAVCDLEVKLVALELRDCLEVRLGLTLIVFADFDLLLVFENLVLGIAFVLEILELLAEFLLFGERDLIRPLGEDDDGFVNVSCRCREILDVAGDGVGRYFLYIHSKYSTPARVQKVSLFFSHLFVKSVQLRAILALGVFTYEV